MTETKQTEIERAFTLLARSDQWATFVGDEVNAKTIDALLFRGGYHLSAITLLCSLRPGLLRNLVMHIIKARAEYLDARDVDHPRPDSQPVGHIVPKRGGNADDGFPEHNVADLIRWDQLTNGVEVPF